MSFSKKSLFQTPVTTMGFSLIAPSKIFIPKITPLDCGYAVPYRYVWNHNGVISHFWRAYYNEMPGWKIMTAQETFELKPDSILILPDHLAFDTKGLPEMNSFWLHFSIDLPQPHSYKEPFYIPLNPLHREILSAIKEQTGMVDADTKMTVHRLTHLCSALMQVCFAGIPPIHIEQKIPPQLARIMQLVQAHPASDLSNATLARHGGINLDTLIKLFKTHLDLTPALYVSRARVEHVSRQLAFTDRSLEQIAEECGFPNRNYMTRVFTKMTGTAPATFRKHCQKQSTR